MHIKFQSENSTHTLRTPQRTRNRCIITFLVSYWQLFQNHGGKNSTQTSLTQKDVKYFVQCQTRAAQLNCKMDMSIPYTLDFL